MTRHFTNRISVLFGRFAGHAFPGPVQRFINNAYVKIMGLDMHEFDAPVSYPTLNALFTRKLMHPRSVSKAAADFVAPCDAVITAYGAIKEATALQIKGMHYSVAGLLGPQVDAANIDNVRHGQYINFYLSPRDYHRYHAPTDLTIQKAVHIPGKLFPVNVPSLMKRTDLFIENERIVLECLTSQQKLLYIVLVGALNVGKMQLAFVPELQTNCDTLEPTVYNFEDLHVKKGEDFGCFEMGSTLVVICETMLDALQVKNGEKVRFGETIATIG